jgi:hypothetical protein
MNQRKDILEILLFISPLPSGERGCLLARMIPGLPLSPAPAVPNSIAEYRGEGRKKVSFTLRK